MLNNSRHHRHDAGKRCAICDGRFGLIRYYSRRTAVCSKKCLDRFRSRTEGDSRWLCRCHAPDETRRHGAAETARYAAFRHQEMSELHDPADTAFRFALGGAP